MSNKKLASGYAKIASVISKISIALLIVSVLGWIVSAVLKRTFTDPWPIYYAAVTEQACTWATIVLAVIYVIFDFQRFWPVVKELVRKFIVTLKRNPSLIPLAMLFVSFLLFSLNLTDLSDTTAKIQGKGMGLAQFSVMLFSLLSMVCLLNAFPKRKKANIPMVVLAFVMFAIIIYADIHYCNSILAALYRKESPIQITTATEYIAMANNMLNVHMVLVIITAALVALLPIYSKLLKKIKTSVDVEGNENMQEIEIED